MLEPVVALFTGSREWSDRNAVSRVLADFHHDSLVIEGGARGLDSIVRDEAQRRGLHVATVPALWDLFGKAAGHRRNAAMLRLRPDVVYAFPLPHGKGTQMMIRLAQEAGVPVETPAQVVAPVGEGR